MNINAQLKLEELGMFLLGVFLFTLMDYRWWVFPMLILVPDISMCGYIINPWLGAFIYNLFHHKGVAVLAYAVGSILGLSWLALAGIILFAHSSMDRILGYGLKYEDSFHHTHLGRIGKHANL